jgi:Fe2+ or Zn2+ uptake regulation protein
MCESPEQVRTLFRAAGKRLTHQRELILETLEKSSKHLDAEAIHDRVRREDPDISLATVYRTLTLLKELGLVEVHSLGTERCRYESAGDTPHYHFTCIACGKVIEFDTPLVTQVSENLSEREGIRVTEAHLHVRGYCAECVSSGEGRDNDVA